MSEVRRKLAAYRGADPRGRAPADDPWADFRDVELLDFELAFRFRHSLGKLSRFFLALEERRLLATHCPHCDAVWMPPRATCPKELAVTRWTEIAGRGTLAAATVVAPRSDADGGSALGYVALEGTSTLLLQRIRNYGDPARLVAGLPVRVAWAESPVDHPMELFWFEPEP